MRIRALVMAPWADHALVAASTTTARIQQAQLLMPHILGQGVDAWAASTEV